MRLPRTRSMRWRSEFLNVRKQGRSFGGRFLVLATLKAGEIEEFKVGFVVPRYVGNAVHRNAVKRRLHGIVASRTAEIDPHRYVVTIARRGAAEQSFATLQREWLWLAKRAKLLLSSPPSAGEQLKSSGMAQELPSRNASPAPPATSQHHG
ncbi:MAG: ribonuclease P protein component [Verrucomicrobiales bacterium]